MTKPTTIKISAWTLSVCAVIGVSATQAAAQVPCGQRTDIVVSLEKTYSEAPVSRGLTAAGAVVEVFSSTTGTFTIVLTQPNGLTCLVAAGEYWEAVPRRVADKGV